MTYKTLEICLGIATNSRPSCTRYETIRQEYDRLFQRHIDANKTEFLANFCVMETLSKKYGELRVKRALAG